MTKITRISSVVLYPLLFLTSTLIKMYLKMREKLRANYKFRFTYYEASPK